MKRIVSLWIVIFSLFTAPAHARVPVGVDVLVVGAGLSGLSTAYQLRKAGLSVHILELTQHIGGRVRTVKYTTDDGEEISADSGMEEYWESNPAVKLLKEFGLPLRNDAALSSIILNGKQYDYTEETDDLFLKKVFNDNERKDFERLRKEIETMLPKIEVRPLSKDLLKLKDTPFGTWVRAQKVAPKVAEWVRVSIECEVGTEWEKLSALDGIAEFHVFVGKMEKSFRVIGGNEGFTDALTAAVGRENISTNHRVSKIETKGDIVYVSYLDQESNRMGTIRASHVVTTVPLFRLAMEVQFIPGLSKKKTQAIQSQTYGSYFKAHVFMTSEAAEKFFKKGEEMPFPLLSDGDLGVVYNGNPDQKTKTRIISHLLIGARAEAFNFMNQDAARERLTAAYEKMWPGSSKFIKGMEFYRYHPRAIAGWPVGRSRFDELSDEVRKPENRVYLAGDWSEGTHSSGAFLSAERVTKQILAAEKAGKK